ncbi:MAG: nucleotidyltransferase family protein [Bacteroidia bacterium]|jgi:D-glycero-alpha-D-manno-heptose 1-phosphate guanylyltransferase
MKLDVIILAGGLGTRLASVVSDVPKPMAPVAGQPFLEQILKHLPKDHIRKIILAVGYKYEKIEEHYGKSYLGIPLEYSIEKEPLGTGGGIGLALAKTTADQILILNGDTYFDVNIEEMLQIHNDTNALLTLALKQIASPDRYGTVLLQDHSIVRFQEKQEGLSTGLINGGVYLASKSLIVHLPQKDKYSFETAVLEAKVSTGLLKGYISQGLFIDIGIPQDYERAQTIFA